MIDYVLLSILKYLNNLKSLSWRVSIFCTWISYITIVPISGANANLTQLTQINHITLHKIWIPKHTFYQQHKFNSQIKTVSKHPQMLIFYGGADSWQCIIIYIILLFNISINIQKPQQYPLPINSLSIPNKKIINK